MTCTTSLTSQVMLHRYSRTHVVANVSVAMTATVLGYNGIREADK